MLFIPDTNAIEALKCQLRKAAKTEGHFPPRPTSCGVERAISLFVAPRALGVHVRQERCVLVTGSRRSLSLASPRIRPR
jgi:hypothetical protein